MCCLHRVSFCPRVFLATVHEILQHLEWVFIQFRCDRCQVNIVTCIHRIQVLRLWLFSDYFGNVVGPPWFCHDSYRKLLKTDLFYIFWKYISISIDSNHSNVLRFWLFNEYVRKLGPKNKRLDGYTTMHVLVYTYFESGENFT